MKNIEWGAVAFLSHIQYCKYGNDMYQGAYKEVYQNKSSELITGSSNGTPGQSGARPGGQCAYNDMTDLGEGKGLCGPGASTTGNIYGVYDMSGGSYEYVMGNYNNLVGGYSGFADNNEVLAINSYYITRYETLTSEMLEGVGMDYDERIYGDAIYETSIGVRYNGTDYVPREEGGKETGSWYGDTSYLPHSSSPWFNRGGNWSNSSNAGVFYFNNSNDKANINNSFRYI